jgi:transposase
MRSVKRDGYWSHPEIDTLLLEGYLTMNATERNVENIVAIDLGKFNSAVCIFKKSTFKSNFRTVKTAGQDFHDLFVELEPDVVLIEAGSSAGWVADLLRKLNIPFEVANTNHEAWKWNKNKNKTDKRDAKKLAMMYSYGGLPTVHMPTMAVRQKRSLVNYRQSIVKRVTQSKNVIRALLQTIDVEMLRGKNAWTQKGIDYLSSIAKPFDQVEDMEQLWRSQLHTEIQILKDMTDKLKAVTKKLDKLANADKKIELVQTIPGVGPRVAEAVVAIIDDPRRFKSAKHISSYAGLVPEKHDSGQTKRNGRITGHGSGMLRALLVQVSWLGLKNKWIRDIYDRIRRGSKTRSKIAIVAVARHILVRCWAMLRDNSTWRGSVELAVKN